jgi:hypothetical protein
MNIRDLKPSVLRHLATEGDEEYEKWNRDTQGLSFGSREPIAQKELWRLAFSKGVSAILRRVDNIKE